MNWTVKEEFGFDPGAIVSRADSSMTDPGRQIIRENNVRISMLISLRQDGDDKVFLKRYKQKDWKDGLKYLFFSSKAATEWRAINKFLEKGIPVPRPLAFGEDRRWGILKDSCLITEAISQAVTLSAYQEYFLPEKISPGSVLRKRDLTKKLARLIHSIHNQGIFYRDLHGENILLDKNDNGEAKFSFVDLHKARFSFSLSSRKRIYDLAKLLHSLSPKKTDCFRFLREYAKNDSAFGHFFKKYAVRIENRAQKLRSRHEKSRTKRCLITGSGFLVNKKGCRQTYLRREYEKRN